MTALHPSSSSHELYDLAQLIHTLRTSAFPLKNGDYNCSLMLLLQRCKSDYVFNTQSTMLSIE